MEFLQNNYQAILMVILVAFMMTDKIVRYVFIRGFLFLGAGVLLIYVVRYVSVQ